MARKIYVGAENFEKVTLPTGYTQVEYIESNGTQWVDTGVVPSKEIELSISYMVTSANSAIFGADWNENGFFLIDWQNEMLMHSGGSITTIGASELNSISTAKISTSVATLNGKDTALTYSSANTTAYNIYLFMVGSLQNSGFAGKMRLYGCSIKNESGLVRNFIPCINASGTVGLYDLVNDNFYGNNGTGTFTAGSSAQKSVARKVKKMYVGVEQSLPSGYTQVEYIQSSGTQYIDTGFAPNQDTRVVCELAFSEINGTNHAFGARTGTANNAFCFYISSTNYMTFKHGNKTVNLDASLNTTSKILVDLNKNELSINGNVVGTADAVTFSSTVPMCLFGTNTNGTLTNGKVTIYSCKVYDNGSLIRNFIPCTNSSGTAGLYDVVKGKFYENSGTGAFTVGGTVNLHNSVARRVKKAYIGVGGVARPFFGEMKLSYYGSVTALSTARFELASTTIGNYALFGGGHGASSDYTTTVEAYDSSLVRTLPTALTQARGYPKATTVGNYALFAGGGIQNTVDAYNTSLTKQNNVTNMDLGTRKYHTATTIGDYALFAGGTSNSYLNSVNAYSSSLTKNAPTALSVARQYLASTSVGDYALFGGGNSGSSSAVVDAYNTSLTRTNPTGLSVARFALEATTVGNYALFGGGNASGTFNSTVDAYDKSLTRTTITPLSVGKGYLCATSVGNFALFGGGNTPSSGYTTTVDAYDESLTKTTPTGLSEGKVCASAVSIGDYALIGGGSTNSTEYSSTVEAYVLE